MQPPFAPTGYVPSLTTRAHVWKLPGTPTEPFEAILDDAVASVERLLDFKIRCQLHIVIYDSNAAARAALDRPVPASMLLVPFQTAALSVIAVQSSVADPLNGNIGRMHRQLSHELAHVAASLRTGSEKRLGDDDRQMRIQPWVNEGFACVVAALASDRLDLLERAVMRESHRHIADLNGALND